MDDMAQMDKMYSDTEGGGDKSGTETKSDKEDMMTTAVVPLKALQSDPEMKISEGDEIVVKVVKVYGDEAEIAYAPKEKPEEKHDMAMADDKEIESMSQEGMS